MKKKDFYKELLKKTKKEEFYKNKIKSAIVKVEKEQRKAKIKKIKKYHLLERFPEIAKEAGLDVEEMSVFFKIKSKNSKNKKAIYVSRNGSNVDLVGFSIENPIFIGIDRERAKRLHLGRITSRLSLDGADDAAILEAYKTALGQL